MMAISSVLNDDNLLSEILLCVAFPTSLLYVALVSKRWLHLASYPIFLRRFRDLHPPSLLGFYVNTRATKPPRFVPMPQPPELTAVVRRANFDLGNLGSNSFALSVDCWNGLLLLTSYTRHGQPKRTVCYPLYPARHGQFWKPASRTMSSHATKKRSSQTAAAMASSFWHLAQKGGKQLWMCMCYKMIYGPDTDF
ncbi:hypothetical protein D1007_61426 [Hordeum vulgare]|nr:hypothetical protein D1007_61426 [Hordeum vulgare]